MDCSGRKMSCGSALMPSVSPLMDPAGHHTHFSVRGPMNHFLTGHMAALNEALLLFY